MSDTEPRSGPVGITREELIAAGPHEIYRYAKRFHISKSLPIPEILDQLFEYQTTGVLLIPKHARSFRKGILEGNLMDRHGIDTHGYKFIEDKADDRTLDPDKPIISHYARAHTASNEPPKPSTRPRGLQRSGTPWTDAEASEMPQNGAPSATRSSGRTATNDADTEHQQKEGVPSSELPEPNTFPIEHFPSPPSDDDEEADDGANDADAENALPPICDFVYPPNAPLDESDPRWMSLMMEDLERQTAFLEKELDDATDDVRDGIYDAALAKAELDDEMNKWQALLDSIAKVAGKDMVKYVVDEAERMADKGIWFVPPPVEEGEDADVDERHHPAGGSPDRKGGGGGHQDSDDEDDDGAGNENKGGQPGGEDNTEDDEEDAEDAEGDVDHDEGNEPDHSRSSQHDGAESDASHSSTSSETWIDNSLDIINLDDGLPDSPPRRASGRSISFHTPKRSRDDDSDADNSAGEDSSPHVGSSDRPRKAKRAKVGGRVSTPHPRKRLREADSEDEGGPAGDVLPRTPSGPRRSKRARRHSSSDAPSSDSDDNSPHSPSPGICPSFSIRDYRLSSSPAPAEHDDPFISPRPRRHSAQPVAGPSRLPLTPRRPASSASPSSGSGSPLQRTYAFHEGYPHTWRTVGDTEPQYDYARDIAHLSSAMGLRGRPLTLDAESS